MADRNMLQYDIRIFIISILRLYINAVNYYIFLFIKIMVRFQKNCRLQVMAGPRPFLFFHAQYPL